MFHIYNDKIYNFNAKNCSLLFISVMLFSLYAHAQNAYPLVRTATNVPANYTLPKNVLKPDEPLTVSFSKEPKDEEIFRAHFFEEPLVPMEGKGSSEENTVLVFALASFSQRTNPDDFTAITNFLKQYPDGRWRGALLANLGIIYRRIGYYTKALEVWQNAWNVMKDEKDKKVKALADRTVAEILEMYCWVGRQNEIDSLLKETGNRTIEGSSYQRILSVQAALYIMKARPGVAFKCGPYALNKLYTLKDSTKPFSDKTMEAQSTSKGFSLYELQHMANAIGLKYQMAFRNPGAPVIENAVVHWNLGHYSALLRKENNHYECEDATASTFYGQKFWLTSAALDSSASGYFLVPEGLLPIGWRKASVAEGSNIFGRGVVPKPKGPWPHWKPDCPDGTCCSSNGMARCNLDLSSINLNITDKPFFYSVPKGPAINFSVSYNQREIYQPQNFTFSNIGPQWAFNWLSYIQDDPNNTSADIFQYMIEGGQREITGYNASTNSYAPELYTKDVVERTSSTCYVIHHSDGSQEVYGRPDGNTTNGRKIFLTSIVDVSGNSINISYDNNLRIIAIQDASGQVTTVKYENTDIYKITEVKSLSKSAKFEYDGLGRLLKITDMIGIASSFQYDDNNFVVAMTTPYGVTSFEKQDGPDNFSALQINYPLGAKERAEFKENAPGIPFSDSVVPKGMNLFNIWLPYRNTFYWDKKQMLEAPGDYSKATLYHWIHGAAGTDENGFAAPILESMKRPLENRIWYNYQGQSSPGFANLGMSSKPSKIGQVQSDGTTQLKQFAFNELGNDTLMIDPSGRSTSYKFDSTQIDLLEVRQTTNGVNELLTKNTYDPQHPHLVKTTTDASGQKTSYTYNAAGQVATITNARKEKTTFTYDANGYLKTITGAVPGATTNFTYDGFGRVRTVTDAEGYTITTDYDELDRPTVITYPNNTFKQIVYDRLDAIATKDRLGRWTHYLYDSLRRLNAVTDPSGKIIQYIWCTCGNLSEIIDPLKHITTFNYDLQSRLISKIYDDGKAITYKYDTTSRMIEMTDAKGQTTKYSYYIDDNIKQVDYTNAVIATTSVFYSYDDKYNRLDTMTDGTGTTAYAYYPVKPKPTLGTGKLQRINGPLANDDIVYTYDTLGRIKSRSINGVASSTIYDALGRVTSATNALGTFGYSYINTTNRIANITNPNSTTTAFTYFDNLGDQRLKEIWNKKGSATISKFDYEYNNESQITKWTQQAGNGVPKYYDLGYDLSDQLTSATQKDQTSNAVQKRYAYQYDKSGNRTSEQIDNSITSATFNTLNQVTAQQDGGPMRFKGTVNEFASVLVKNTTAADSVNAPVDSLTNSFEAFVKVTPGIANNILITATDYSGNSNKSSNTFNVTPGHGTNNTLSFDDNGNTISATNPAVTYGWDAANRLVKITQGANVTEFVYDGLSRRVAEKLNGTVIKRWLWCGTELCEERNAIGSTVTKRFFKQGEQMGGTNYYFTKDHLGSVRELTDNAGSLITRYDYDPYGRRTKLSGTIDADLGFTGHYYHPSSGLYFTLYRAYNASLGRWLSRDPLKKAELFQGPNLYYYVKNKLINRIDRLGLQSIITLPPNYLPLPPFHVSPEDVNDPLSPYYNGGPTINHGDPNYNWNNWHNPDPNEDLDPFEGLDYQFEMNRRQNNQINDRIPRGCMQEIFD